MKDPIQAVALRPRRTALRRLSALCATLAVAASSPTWAAADYPTQPIKLVLGYAPGGSIDAVARAISPGLSKALGQTVVVDYKPGASGLIGARAVAGADPDGYTIHLVESATLVVLPSLRDVGYSPTQSFTPIGMVATAGMLLAANKSVPAKNLSEMSALLKNSPATQHYATSGIGSVGHVGMELLQLEQGLQALHVAYKGGGPAMADLLGGQVPFIVSSLAPALPQVRAGTIQPIGLMAPTRSSALPDVPTIAEQGVPGFDASAWYALVGPANMPASAVEKLQQALALTLAEPAVQNTLREQGMDTVQETGAALGERIDRDLRKWDAVIKQAGIKIE